MSIAYVGGAIVSTWCVTWCLVGLLSVCGYISVGKDLRSDAYGLLALMVMWVLSLAAAPVLVKMDVSGLRSRDT